MENYHALFGRKRNVGPYCFAILGKKPPDSILTPSYKSNFRERRESFWVIATMQKRHFRFSPKFLPAVEAAAQFPLVPQILSVEAAASASALPHIEAAALPDRSRVEAVAIFRVEEILLLGLLLPHDVFGGSRGCVLPGEGQSSLVFQKSLIKKSSRYRDRVQVETIIQNSCKAYIFSAGCFLFPWF